MEAEVFPQTGVVWLGKIASPLKLDLKRIFSIFTKTIIRHCYFIEIFSGAFY
jgi:hypothetical protein